MTIEQLYTHFIKNLINIYQTREAANIADWVFESTAGIKRIDRIVDKRKELNSSTIEQLNHQLQQLLKRQPVQYVLQEAWFYKMKFFVNNAVLIPRPETEELVEWIITDVKNKNEKLTIIDIGTGSGCISIALKKELLAAQVVAIDVSAEALAVARKNALALTANVQFMQTDFLEENEWHKLPLFDIIVSNPPYIPEKEKITMEKNVVAFEPHLALFVGDSDPFIFYKKIVLFGSLHLKMGGKIYVEVHEQYANDVNSLFVQHNFFSTIKKDMYGRLRMICAYR